MEGGAPTERDWSFIVGHGPRRDRTGAEFWALLAGIGFLIAGIVVWGGFSGTANDSAPLLVGDPTMGLVLCALGAVICLGAAWSHFRSN